MAGNSPVYSHGCKPPLPVAELVAGKPSCNPTGRKPYFRYSSQGCGGMTLYRIRLIADVVTGKFDMREAALLPVELAVPLAKRWRRTTETTRGSPEL